MATEDADIPETGAIFTFGKSKFGDNVPSKFWIRDDLVTQVACGDEHTALVSESGKLFTFGSNDWGQLGLGHNKPITKPSRVKSLKSEKVILVTCGRTHTVIATASGKLFAFGNNGDSQLGIGPSGTDGQNQTVPQCIDSLDEGIQWQMLSAGNDHSCALTVDGLVYVWGSNSDGQCGIEDEDEIPTPKLLKLSEKIVAVSCGYYHTAFVTASGKLLTCGEAEDGKLGLEVEESVHTPTHVDGVEERVSHVACGGTHTIALTESGKAYSFGKGENGQLGHGTKVQTLSIPMQITTVKDQFCYVSCGENHSALVSEKGKLYTFGDGRHGKLALGEENFANQFRLTFVSRFDNLFVQKVSCGGCHTLAVAKPAVENGHVNHENEDKDEIDASPIPKPKRLSQMDHLRESMDLEGSIGARNRRREKLPDPSTTLNSRVLPSLSSSFTATEKQSLSHLNTAPHVSESYDSALKEKHFPIHKANEPSVQSLPSQREDKEEEEDESSGVSVTESEEEEEEEEKQEGNTQTNSKQMNSVHNSPPEAKPRPEPRIQETKRPLPASRSAKKVSYEDQGQLPPISKHTIPVVNSKIGKKKFDEDSVEEKKAQFSHSEEEESEEEGSEEEKSEEEEEKNTKKNKKVLEKEKKAKDKEKEKKDNKERLKKEKEERKKEAKKKKDQAEEKKTAKKKKKNKKDEDDDESEQEEEKSEEENSEVESEEEENDKDKEKNKKADKEDKEKVTKNKDTPEPTTQKKSGTCTLL